MKRAASKRRVLSAAALARIKNIHSLSGLYNRKVKMPHNRRLFELVRHHVDEIEELFGKNDRHYLTETGDLLILCCELLLEGRASLDATFLKCFGRYERKLAALLREAGSSK